MITMIEINQMIKATGINKEEFETTYNKDIPFKEFYKTEVKGYAINFETKQIAIVFK